MNTYIGIDLGTSGCRAIAIDPAGAVLGEARVAFPANPGTEQDPAPWWRAVLEVLRALAGQCDLRAARGLAVDGTSATLLLADAAGEPLGPALMYHDARAQSQAARIREIAPACSAAHGATSSLAKLMYLHEIYPRARFAMQQADWIAGRLCGRYGLSDENNCLKLGYDPQRRVWPDWLDRLGIARELLPKVFPPGALFGYLRPELAARLGLPADLRILAGTTDSTAAFLATGASEPGEAVTVLGSTLVLKVLSPGPVFAPEYGVYSHRLGDLWLAGGASNSGGAVLLQHFSQARLLALTPGLRPRQPTGLDYYPLCRPGERFPVSDPAWPPRLTPRPANDTVFFQAMLEGMARIEQHGYALLHRLGAPAPRNLRTTGGGAVNPGWREIRRQLLGLPMLPALHGEAAYGSARLALRARP
jgi:sugar (pentulose or hexulose) kinase